MRNKKQTWLKLAKVGTVIMVGAIALTACQSKEAKIDPLAGGGGLTGKWVSTDNVFTAQLDNGNFFSTANDTGEVLSEGTYVVISATEIKMNWRGKLSQQENSANCQRDGVGVLNCTDIAGKGFSLRKVEVTG